MSCELYAVFLPGKELALRIEYEAECVTHVVWTLWIVRAVKIEPRIAQL